MYEDNDTLAFLDIRPVNPGHTLVIPKEHFRNVLDVPDSVFAKVAVAAQKVARAVKSGMQADGVNVSSSHEPAAGQEVFHLHLHIIPRFESDGLKHWPHKEYGPDEPARVAEHIRAAIEKI